MFRTALAADFVGCVGIVVGSSWSVSVVVVRRFLCELTRRKAD